MQVAQRNLEIAYHNSGYYDRRVAELRERLRQAPDDRDARWELGRAYAILGQQAEAVAEFEQLLGQRPKDVAAILQLGLAEKNRGRPEVATEWFVRARELDPDSSVVWFYLGEIYYNRGLNAEALQALEKAVELNPDNAHAHYLMAFVLGDMGRHQEARAASKRAIQLNPPLARAQTNLSLERYNAERRSQQLRARESPEPQVVEGNELAHYNLGLAFRQKGYYNEALREYRLALERGEDRRLTLQAMAEVHLLKRDFPSALELYETLLREVPDSPKLWNERGVVLHQGGRSDDALASYKQAVEIDPKYALAWNNLGVVEAHTRDTDGAIEALRTALQLQGTFSAARLNLALLLYQLRQFQLTIDLQYERATIGIAPEISADVTAETIGEDFAFDQRLLDNIFQELAPVAPPRAVAQPAADDPLALARDYVSKGLMDVAAAEAVRAVQRGANRAEAAVLLGDIFAKRGLYGEALERYREARALEPQRADALLGEVKALFALGGERATEARALAEQLLTLTPEDVEALVAVARGRAAAGDAAGALTALHQAQTREPGRADLHKLQGDVAHKVGDKRGALAAYRAALELDPGYVQVWLDLGRLHEEKRSEEHTSELQSRLHLEKKKTKIHS